MTIFDMPNFLWISILAVIILTVFCTLVLHRWFIAAVISFVLSVSYYGTSHVIGDVKERKDNSKKICVDMNNLNMKKI